MNKWIIFDVDDVLCMYRESLYQSFKARGKDIHWSRWETYRHADIYGLETYEELIDYMVDNAILENSELEPGALAFMQAFKEQGYSIGLLTARGWHDKAMDITQAFVQKYHLPVDKIVIAGFMKKKTDYIPEFEGDIVAFLDDSASHIEDFIQQGIAQSYVMDRPWNQHRPDLPRVMNYEEFTQKILSVK